MGNLTDNQVHWIWWHAYITVLGTASLDCNLGSWVLGSFGHFGSKIRSLYENLPCWMMMEATIHSNIQKKSNCDCLENKLFIVLGEQFTWHYAMTNVTQNLYEFCKARTKLKVPKRLSHLFRVGSSDSACQRLPSTVILSTAIEYSRLPSMPVMSCISSKIPLISQLVVVFPLLPVQ